jgi:hypothetical protein
MLLLQTDTEAISKKAQRKAVPDFSEGSYVIRRIYKAPGAMFGKKSAKIMRPYPEARKSIYGHYYRRRRVGQ